MKRARREGELQAVGISPSGESLFVCGFSSWVSRGERDSHSNAMSHPWPSYGDSPKVGGGEACRGVRRAPRV